MSPEFQELAKLITQQVTDEVADRVTERVVDRIRKEMDERFADTNARISDLNAQGSSLSAQVTSLTEQVTSLTTEIPLMIHREVEQLRTEFDHKIDLLNRRIDSLALLVENVSDSLHREMRAGFAQMEDMSRRLDKHASMLQTGARWTARMATWSERVDQRVTAHEQRLQRLEGERPQTPPAA